MNPQHWNDSLRYYVDGLSVTVPFLLVIWLFLVLLWNRIWKRCCSRPRRYSRMRLLATFGGDEGDGAALGSGSNSSDEEDVNLRTQNNRHSSRSSADRTSALSGSGTYVRSSYGSPSRWTNSYGENLSSTSLSTPGIEEARPLATDETSIPLPSRVWVDHAASEARDEFFDSARNFVHDYMSLLQSRWNMNPPEGVDVAEHIPLNLGSNIVVVGEGSPDTLYDSLRKKNFSSSMLLTGPSGSGKSFQMQSLALRMLRDIYHSSVVSRSSPLPIVVDCSMLALTSCDHQSYTGGDFQLIRDLLWLEATGYNDRKTELLRQKWDEIIDYALCSNRLLLIFDSLDFFEPAKFPKIVQAISMFCRDCPFILVGRDEDQIREALQEDISRDISRFIVGRSSLLSFEMTRQFFENYCKIVRSRAATQPAAVANVNRSHLWTFSQISGTILIDFWESHRFRYPFHLLQLCTSLAGRTANPVFSDVEAEIEEKTRRHFKRAAKNEFPNAEGQILTFLEDIVMYLSYNAHSGEYQAGSGLSKMSFMLTEPLLSYSVAQLRVFTTMLFYLRAGCFELGGAAFRINPVFFDCFGKSAWLHLAHTSPQDIKTENIYQLVSTGSSMILINLLQLVMTAGPESEFGALAEVIQETYARMLGELRSNGLSNACILQAQPWLSALQAAVFRTKRDSDLNTTQTASAFKTALQLEAGQFCLWALQINSTNPAESKLKLDLLTFQSVEVIFSVCGCSDTNSFELMVTEGLRFPCSKVQDLTFQQITLLDSMNETLQTKTQNFIFSNKSESTQTLIYIDNIQEPYRTRLRYTSQLARGRVYVYWSLWIILLLLGFYIFAKFHPYTNYNPSSAEQQLTPILKISPIDDDFFNMPQSSPPFPYFYKNIIALLSAAVALIISVSMMLNSVLPGLIGLESISSPQHLTWKFWRARQLADLPNFSLFWVLPLIGGIVTLFSLLSTVYGSNCQTAWINCSTGLYPDLNVPDAFTCSNIVVNETAFDGNSSYSYNVTETEYYRKCSCGGVSNCCSLTLSYPQGLWLPCGASFFSLSYFTMFAPVTYAARRLGSWPQLILTLFLSPLWSLTMIPISLTYLSLYLGAILCIILQFCAKFTCRRHVRTPKQLKYSWKLKWTPRFTCIWGCFVIAFMLIVVPMIASTQAASSNKAQVFAALTTISSVGLLLTIIFGIWFTKFGLDATTCKRIPLQLWLKLRIKYVIYKLSLCGLVGSGLLFSVGVLTQIGIWATATSSNPGEIQPQISVAQIVWITGLIFGFVSAAVLGIIRLADARFVRSIAKRDSRNFDVFSFMLDVLWCMHSSSKNDCIVTFASLQVLVKNEQSDEFNRLIKTLLENYPELSDACCLISSRASRERLLSSSFTTNSNTLSQSYA